MSTFTMIVIMSVLMIIGGFALMATPLITFISAGYFIITLFFIYGIFGVIRGISEKRYDKEFIFAAVSLVLGLIGLFVPGAAAMSNYVLLLENENGEDLSIYSGFADDVLCRVNKRYGELVDYDFGRLEIKNLKPGTNREWMDERVRNGASDVQIKPVRILDTPEKEAFFMERLI